MKFKGTRRQFLATTSAGLSALAAGALVGCGDDDDDDGGSATTQPTSGSGTAAASTTPSGETPKQGGELTLSQPGDPPSLDPQLTTAGNTTNFGRMLYGQLVAYSLTADATALTIEPSIAKEIEVIDAKTYRFTLRDDVRMHNRTPLDGRLVVAEDIQYSFDRLRLDSPVAGLYSPIDSIEVPDAKTVLFHLKEAYAPFLSVAAEPQTAFIVPKEVVEADGDMTKRPGGSGPFMFDSYEAGVKYTVTRNPDYMLSGYPRVERVTRVIQSDSSALLTAFASGQLSVLPTDPVIDEQLGKLTKFTPASAAGNTTYSLVMNNSLPLFTDPRVRHAILKAINQQRIIDVVFKGEAELSGPIPPGLGQWALSQERLKEYYTPDPNGAKAELADAGQSELAASIVTFSGVGSELNDIAQLIQQDLSDIGVKVNITPQEQAQGRQNVINGNFEMALVPRTTALEPDLHLRDSFATTGSRNWPQLHDDEVDSLVAKQLVETDPATRDAIIQEAQERILELVPEVFVPVAPSTFALLPNLRDYWPSVNSDRPSEIAAWFA